MTVRSVSWISGARVAQLLALASTPRSAGGPVPLVRPMAISGAITRAEDPAGRKTTTAASPKPPTIPALVHESDNPSDRLETLLSWTLRHFGVSGAFVADDNGLTLCAAGISEAHVSIVGPLLSTLVGVRSVPDVDATVGAVWLGEKMMCWVEAPGLRGAFCLGTVSDEALPTPSLFALQRALRTTIETL